MKKLLTILLGCFVMSSCCTIINGSKQEVKISSTPRGAKVIDNGYEIGTTPMIANLKRKESHLLQITLEGYQPYEIHLKRQFNAWYLGNILFGGIIGLVVDPITGAMHKLSPTEINIDFKDPAVKLATAKDGDLSIYVILKENPAGEFIGQLEKADNK